MRRLWVLVGFAVSLVSLATAAGVSASARDKDFFTPGNLLVSRSVYAADPGILQPGSTVLPPGCTTGCSARTAWRC